MFFNLFSRKSGSSVTKSDMGVHFVKKIDINESFEKIDFAKCTATQEELEDLNSSFEA